MDWRDDSALASCSADGVLMVHRLLPAADGIGSHLAPQIEVAAHEVCCVADSGSFSASDDVTFLQMFFEIGFHRKKSIRLAGVLVVAFWLQHLMIKLSRLV